MTVMSPSPRRTAYMLWVLLALFVCRVLGQLIVAVFAPSILPSMEAWYSGLMPYRYLLPSQIVIIALFTKVAYDISSKSGFWARPQPRLGLWLRNFGGVYFAAMIIRYVLRMSWYPEERWFGGTIPIVFHWVLATFIILVGTYHLRESNGNREQMVPGQRGQLGQGQRDPER